MLNKESAIIICDSSCWCCSFFPHVLILSPLHSGTHTHALRHALALAFQANKKDYDNFHLSWLNVFASLPCEMRCKSNSTAKMLKWLSNLRLRLDALINLFSLTRHKSFANRLSSFAHTFSWFSFAGRTLCLARSPTRAHALAHSDPLAAIVWKQLLKSKQTAL